MTAGKSDTTMNLVVLQARSALLDEMAEELRLYRGFVVQFDEAHRQSRLFAPLAAYDALFGDQHGRE